MLSYGTPDTQAALDGIRDLEQMEWIVIPFLILILYIYITEIQKARKSGNWGVIICGLTLFGMDFVNETWNGWVAWLTQTQAFWTTPGPSALKVMVGWNVEIIFMFLISGLVYGKTISEDKNEKIMGINNRWFWAIGYSAFAVFIEIILNIGGLLTWYYPFWNRSFAGIWLIFFFGYFHFFVACILVLKIKSMRKKLIAIGCIYGVAIIMNVIACILGWVY